LTRVYQALAAALAGEGIDTVFCVLGDGNLDLLVEMTERHGVRLVHARHEQGAVAMADGYARRTDGLGVASVTHGPGLTQTATSLKVAATHRSQVLVLAGDTPTGDPAHIQSFEQAPFARAAGAVSVPLRSASTWAADLAEALRTSELGPVVFNMPTDYQLAAADDATPPATDRVRHPESQATRLEEAAAELGRSARPVLIAGRGARHAEAEVAAVAERLAAPVVTTLGVRGLLSDFPGHLGFIGGLGHDRAVRAVDDADCLLAVGASLNPWSTKGGALLRGKRIIRLDADRQALHVPVAADVALLGHARPTLAALVEHLPDGGRERQISAEASEATEAWQDGVDCVDPRRALAAIEAALPPGRTIVMDGGHFITFACSALSAPRPEQFLLTCDFATVGQGLAAAIGASAAAPESRTTLIVGDGGLLMSIAELDTAVRCRLPLDVVVLDDGAYGQEVHSLAAKGKPTAHARFEVPDLGQVARAFGADGHRLRTAADLDRLPELLHAPGGPRVIDIRINGEVVSPAAREIFRQVRQGVETEAPPVTTSLNVEWMRPGDRPAV
jgi:acetolactate synthase I/II/III large subunit